MIVEKITKLLKDLQSETDISGAAVVSKKGQVMVSTKSDDSNEKTIAAMAAALMSVSDKVLTSLSGGNIISINIEGSEKLIIVYPLKEAIFISMAPAKSQIGLLEYELLRAVKELNEILA